MFLAYQSTEMRGISPLPPHLPVNIQGLKSYSSFGASIGNDFVRAERLFLETYRHVKT